MKRFVGWAVLLVLLWSGGMAVRRTVFHQQTRTLKGTEVPFLMESALQYRMTRMVAKKGTLPQIDENVQVPEGVNLRKTYSVGAEWVYAGLAKLLPKDPSLSSRVRWVSIALFCLAIPFAALWVGLKYQSVLGAIATGGVLAISPAFSVRSSGLELSRENLAIPCFTLFFLAETLYRQSGKKAEKWIWVVIAAVSLALAQCFWDLTQYVTGLWVLWSLYCRIKTGEGDADEKRMISAVTVALVLVSWLNPYLRAPASFFSPVMALLLARCLMAWLPPLPRPAMYLLIPVALLGIFGVLGHYFFEDYSHFGELLYAKIRFLNHKPEDPALLNFLQRIMWTPALNSSTWQLTKLYFPLILYIFGIAMLLLIRGVKHGRQRFQAEFFYAGFTLAVYVFFFRFHVFLILFLAVCIGEFFALSKHCQGFWKKWFFPVVGLLLFLGTEFYLLLFFEPKPNGDQLTKQQQIRQVIRAIGGGEGELPKGNRWGHPGVSYNYVAELTQALSHIPEPERGPILANFGISATILADTGFPIVLHPKFETPGIRERVREFYECLFLKSEKDLRDWAVQYGAKYYVHSNGNFSSLDPSNSPRYMVNALVPEKGVSVYTLENHPQDATWFRPIYSNRRYRIYRIITPEDEEQATTYTRLAAMAFEMGDMRTAHKRAMEALSFNWKYPPAQNLLKAVLSQPQP